MKEYKMTKEELEEMRTCIKIVAVLGGLGADTTETSRLIIEKWNSIGVRLGCDMKTAEPSDRGHQYFMAEPTGEDNAERYK